MTRIPSSSKSPPGQSNRSIIPRSWMEPPSTSIDTGASPPIPKPNSSSSHGAPSFLTILTKDRTSSSRPANSRPTASSPGAGTSFFACSTSKWSLSSASSSKALSLCAKLLSLALDRECSKTLWSSRPFLRGSSHRSGLNS